MPAVNVLLFIPKEIFGFLYWWYWDIPEQFILTILNVLKVYLNKAAVPTMLRTLFTPMLHDYTFVGRALSFIVRVIRIVFGLFFNIALLFVLSLFFLTWLAIPVIVVFSFYTSLRILR